MRRRDLIAAGSAALLTATSDGQTAQAPLNPRGTEASLVDVRRDFGAKGDGVADDWQAIENAGLHLERLGGGRLYFPAGRYRLGSVGRNIEIRNNVDYFGDGHGSVIIGSNAAFISPNGAAFGRSAYGSYRYFAIRDIASGDRSLEFVNAADASNFKPGDIVIARSVDAIVTPGDVLPYYVEMNRVTAVSANRVELEDAIDDGWKGLVAANVTRDVVQGYSIHDLRIECESGYPFFIQGSYKSFIRNCWTRGYAVACFNGFTRSMAHDLIAEVIWQPDGTSASLFEIETGCVRANFHDIDVYLSGSARAGARYPLVYCQEFSRRTTLRNIRIAAAGTDLGTLFEVMSGGHRFENVDVTARSVDKVMDYWVTEPDRYQLGHLGLAADNITIETLDPANGFNHGYILHNDHPDGEVRNVTLRDCSIRAATDQREHNLIWFYRGRHRNVLFDGVSGPGLATMNVSRPDRPQAGPSGTAELSYPLSNIMLRNCEFTRLGSQEMLEQARFVGCRRINADLPAPVRCPAGTTWSSNRPRPQMIMEISPQATICRGDIVSIKVAAWYAARPFPAHILIKAMGVDVLKLALVPSVDQDLDLDLALTFAGGSFQQPERVMTSGPVRINNAMLPSWTSFSGAFDRGRTNHVEVHAWIDQPAELPAAITIKRAMLEFREVERDG
jgi:hypothetical protein